MKRENEDVRKAARVADVPLYAVARELGISEPTLYRWLRSPLSADREKDVLGAIERLEQVAN